MNENDIKNSMVNDTDSPPRQQTSLSTPPLPANTPGVLDDTTIAKNMLTQAETFLLEAARLQNEAYTMSPGLKPKKGRPKKATVDANT